MKAYCSIYSYTSFQILKVSAFEYAEIIFRSFNKYTISFDLCQNQI